MPSTEEISKLIATGAERATADILRRVKDAATNFRPDGYGDLTTQRRHYYEGKQLKYLRAHLAKLYPNTSHRITPVVLNYIKLIAEQDSDAYREPPTREVLDDNGEAVETDWLAPLLKQARIDRVMPEAERRNKISRTTFIRVSDSRVEGRTRLDLFWPNDVWVLPNPEAPSSIEHAFAVVLKVAGPGGSDDEWFEFWWRVYDAQTAAYGGWKVERVSREGERAPAIFDASGAPTQDWPGSRLPIVAIHEGIPDGPYLDDDNDLVCSQDTINESWTEIQHMIRTQAHALIWHSGINSDRSVVGGPGSKLAIGPGEQIGVINPNPQIAQVMESAAQYTRALAVTRRQSPDAYSTDQAVLTGISRQIANIPHEEARAESIARYKDAEEHDLLPVLIEVASIFGRTEAPEMVGGFRVSFHGTDRYEDPTARQNRALQALDRKIISKAQAMAETEFWDSEEEAQEWLDEQEAPAPVDFGEPTADGQPDDESAEPAQVEAAGVGERLGDLLRNG